MAEQQSENLLEVSGLHVQYRTDDAIVHAINGLSLRVKQGEKLGLVGETGAGKTTLALSILRLLPAQVGEIIQGSIVYRGDNLLEQPESFMLGLRGKRISMIFQDPMTCLNPTITVGQQILEVLDLHFPELSKAEKGEKVDEILKMVGIPPSRKEDFPHQFSGGMKQRVVIAIALACNPKLLIADEPTTALDVTIQAQVLDLMGRLKKQYETAMIMITHDLGIVAEICDEVAVMYAGKIVERGTLEEVFDHTKHPYTEGLFNSLPNIQNRKAELTPIPGLMPDPSNLPAGCAFAPRCPYATEACEQKPAALQRFSPTHEALCSAYERPGFHIARKEVSADG